jgi:hypothetical protein
MDEKSLYEVLSVLNDRLEGVLWALYGSLNLRLQGLDVKFNDIDIATTSDYIFDIEKKLSGYLVEKTHKVVKPDRESYVTLYDIEGYEVEVIADILEMRGGRLVESDNWKFNDLVDLSYKGLSFKVFSLSTEYEGYRKLNRMKDEKKLELLRKVL